MKSRVGRDHAGIGSFLLGTAAVLLIVAGVVASSSGQFKLAALLGVVMGPAVFLITLVGFTLAFVSIVKRVEVKWGALGMVLNCTLLLVTTATTVLPALVHPGPPPSAPYTLASGKQIKIISVGPAYFAKGPPALILNCETETSIDDLPNLRKEADEIWAKFKHDVESAGMTNAVIRMNHNEIGGFVTHGKNYGFVFEKRADGQWHCLDDDKDRAGRPKG
jgi:hypothetical protein